MHPGLMHPVVLQGTGGEGQQEEQERQREAVHGQESPVGIHQLADREPSL